MDKKKYETNERKKVLKGGELLTLGGGKKKAEKHLQKGDWGPLREILPERISLLNIRWHLAFSLGERRGTQWIGEGDPDAKKGVGLKKLSTALKVVLHK